MPHGRGNSNRTISVRMEVIIDIEKQQQEGFKKISVSNCPTKKELMEKLLWWCMEKHLKKTARQKRNGTDCNQKMKCLMYMTELNVWSTAIFICHRSFTFNLYYQG